MEESALEVFVSLVSIMLLSDVSSAYKTKLKYELDSGISFMYIRNSKGPSIHPWGTPVVRDKYEDLAESISTYCSLFVR